MSHDSSLTNHNADVYRKNANFVFSQDAVRPILASLDAKQGERIVDLGCGSGELTQHLACLVGSAGQIVGIDSNSDMLAKATAFVSDLKNVTFLPPVDIQQLPEHLPSIKEQSFDAIFSNAVLHWCKANPLGVLQGCKRLLKPDGAGRLVVEMGGHMNMIGVRGAIHAALTKRNIAPEPIDPWFFPRPEEYKQLLVEAGLKPTSLELVPRPTSLPTDLHGWLATFARRSFLSSLPDALADEIMNDVVRECEVDCKDWEGKWEVMYVRLRIVATT